MHVLCEGGGSEWWGIVGGAQRGLGRGGGG